MPGEFDLIARYFAPLDHANSSIRCGIGDDAAVIACTHPMAITMDTLVEGIHFLPEDPPQTLGHKALAVNLSDLAAMGAKPFAYLLALTLPKIDHEWLAFFSRGLSALADQYGISLIGGDTTSGPLTITITALGHVHEDRYLRRDTAKPGDDIYVTGVLGAAAMWLKAVNEGVALSADVLATCESAYRTPNPQVAFGLALVGHIHACIDVSDGLVSDLGHILKASQVGARVDVGALPLSPALSVLSRDAAQQLALSGGDDYVLCLTAPKSARETIQALAQRCQVRVTRIGEVTDKADALVLERDGHHLDWSLHGWDHF